MIICKDGCYAYVGATVNEAFDAYNSSDEVNGKIGPHDLEWYSATEMTLTMTLIEKPKPAAAKTAAKK